MPSIFFDMNFLYPDDIPKATEIEKSFKDTAVLDQKKKNDFKRAWLTEHMQVCAGADGRHAAAAKHGLALVVAGVGHQGAQYGQPTVEVAQAASNGDAVLPPGDAQLDERPVE